MINLFRVDYNFYNKHIILKCLFDIWISGYNRTNGGVIITDDGRVMTVLDIMDKTKISKVKVDLIIIYLNNQGFINMHRQDSDLGQKNHKWIITEKGKEAVSNNLFLNERGDYNLKLLFDSGGLILSVVSLIVSVYFASQSNSLEQKLDKMQIQVDSLIKKAQHLK